MTIRSLDRGAPDQLLSNRSRLANTTDLWAAAAETTT